MGGPKAGYQILFEPRAERDYGRLSADILRRVNEAIERLVAEPRHRGAAKLAGRNDYRIRVGAWRVIYEVDDERRRVVIIRIAHRSDVYRRR